MTSDGATTIDRDVDCLACGYNLRGLRGDGLCPECGGRVAESLADWGLAAAAVQPWRRTVRRGVAVAAVEYVVMAAVLLLSRVMDLGEYDEIFMGAMAASAVPGTWWIGRREPGGAARGRLAPWLRAAAVGTAGGYALIMTMEAGWWSAWSRAVTLAFLMTNAVRAGLQMAVLARAARRTPDGRLPRVAGRMAPVAAAVWGLMVPAQFAWGHPWFEWPLVAGVVLSCLGVVAYSGWLWRALRPARPAPAR